MLAPIGAQLPSNELQPAQHEVSALYTYASDPVSPADVLPTIQHNRMPPSIFITTTLADALATVTDRVGSSMQPSSCPDSETRALWTIITSCAATLFACVYKSLHLSVPSPFDGPVLRLVRSLGVMLSCVIFPESVVYAALREYLVAREWTPKFRLAIKVRRSSEQTENTERATPSAHLEIDCDSANTALLAKGSDAKSVSVNKNVVDNDYPMLRWMKSGWMRKLFVRKEDLEAPEWTTTHSTLVGLGGFMLYHDGKPCFTLTAKELLKFIQQGVVDVPDLSKADIDDCSKGDAISKAFVIIQVLWFAVQFLARFPEHFDVTPLEIGTFAYCLPCFITYALSWHKPLGVSRPRRVHWVGSADPRVADDISPGGVLLHAHNGLTDRHERMLGILANIMLFPIVILFSIFMPLAESNPVRYRFRTRSLGAGRLGSNAKITELALLIIALAFGALHLLGWNTVFPTLPEKIVWRTAALATTGSPLVFSFLSVINIETANDILGCNAAILVIPSVIAYLLGRVAILVLMLTTLRDLPPAAYCAIPWVQIFPHF